MNNINVLITSAGVASAINIIKSLRLQKEFNITIITTDVDELAAGLYLANHYYISPLINNFEKYLEFLITICKKHRVEVLYPCYSKELSSISSAKKSFEAIGVKILISSPETIDLCNDKVKMNEFALKLGIKVPKIYTNGDIKNISDSDFPLFVKPVIGSSSIDAIKIDSRKDLDYFLDKYTNPIVQGYIDGQEVTVDVFCNKNSEPIVVSPRLRLSTKAGQSVKGKTIDNTLFIEVVEKLCKAVKMVGACNIQFIMARSELTLIEINPRYAAGGLMLTVYAGANIPQLALKEMLGIQITEKECQVRPGVLMSRYWEEIFIDEEKLRMYSSREVS